MSFSGGVSELEGIHFQGELWGWIGDAVFSSFGMALPVQNGKPSQPMESSAAWSYPPPNSREVESNFHKGKSNRGQEVGYYECRLWLM